MLDLTTLQFKRSGSMSYASIKLENGFEVLFQRYSRDSNTIGLRAFKYKNKHISTHVIIDMFLKQYLEPIKYTNKITSMTRFNEVGYTYILGVINVLSKVEKLTIPKGKISVSESGFEVKELFDFYNFKLVKTLINGDALNAIVKDIRNEADRLLKENNYPTHSGTCVLGMAIDFPLIVDNKNNTIKGVIVNQQWQGSTPNEMWFGDILDYIKSKFPDLLPYLNKNYGRMD